MGILGLIDIGSGMATGENMENEIRKIIVIWSGGSGHCYSVFLENACTAAALFV